MVLPVTHLSTLGSLSTPLWGLLGICLVGCGHDHRKPSATGQPTPPAASGGSDGGNPGGASGSRGDDEDRSVDGPSGTFVVRGATFWQSGEVGDVYVVDGEIASLGSIDRLPDDIFEVDATGRFLGPGFVDSHVHLTYLPVAAPLARSGVLAAVDLAAPLSAFEAGEVHLDVLLSGPMITAVGGYPTQSWGSNGYGLEVATPEQAEQAVNDLVNSGARVIKIPFDGSPVASDETIARAIDAAHEKGLRVAAHALSNESAARAAALGCDVLAHAPTEELADEVVDAWKDRAVVSTLRAFGAGSLARENIKRLFAAGTTVLYGTDLGNSRVVGIDTNELALLEAAGLSRSEVLASATSTPASYWGIEVGTLEVGREASLVIWDENPTGSLEALDSPSQVYFRGELLDAR